MATIESLDQMRARLGEPSAQVVSKFHRRLNARARDFIARAPMLFLGTSDANGQPSVSPKGDGPGFVRVHDDTTLLMPEQKGNRLLQSLQNILANPAVQLIFMVPNTGETLRVDGRASLHDDPQLCEMLVQRGKPALLAIRIEVSRCYFHCAKAFIRSGLWEPSTWPAPTSVSFGAEIAESGGLEPGAVQAFDEAVRGRYKSDL